jgi:ATP-dependent Lhr-like helicase
MPDISSFQPIQTWFAAQGFLPQPFQEDTQQAYREGKSGLLNAPTGSGKTMALFLAFLAEYIENQANTYQKNQKNGLQIIWITPLRALAKDLQTAMQGACDTLQVAWKVALRTGDTTSSEKQKQQRSMPECIITTPESLHILLAQKDCSEIFANLKAIVIDEWHELLGTKRGVQVELAVSRIANIPKLNLRIWGISATIGNMDEAAKVLLALLPAKKQNEKQAEKQEDFVFVKANIHKKLNIIPILPDEVEHFPYVGYLGIRLIDKLLPIIEASQSTLIFTNTRSQTDLWYQQILAAAPHLAGLIAMHHSSIDKDLRIWVENALQMGKLKVVVCTSSLDLGVDFPSVDTVVQVGSPKGVCRFVQRGGRSGHKPNAISNIYFLPTHSLELIESAALRQAVENQDFEHRKPLQKCFDVLAQYLVTLAVGEGFEEAATFEEVKKTYCFQQLTAAEWAWLMAFVSTGGKGLGQYDEYKKVELEAETGLYKVLQKKIATRHRLSIGTIVSEPQIKVQYQKGAYIGMVEESFASSLVAKDVFFFAGTVLEVVHLKDLTLLVQKSKRKKAQIPRWLGGRLPLSSQLAEEIKLQLHDFQVVSEREQTKVYSTENIEQTKVYSTNKNEQTKVYSTEIEKIKPLLEVQQKLSAIPLKNQLLIEKVATSEGYHLFFYPFAGRAMHEILAALLAYRISKNMPISFSMAFNDYGFELLSDQEIDIENMLQSCFLLENLQQDVVASINETEMAKRRFREIAAIGGLLFQGYPNQQIRSRHLQLSAGLLFEVLTKYETDNLLVQQAYKEVFDLQLDYQNFETILHKIRQLAWVFTKPKQVTPFAFPILTDRLREQLSSESLEDRVRKMQSNFVY